MFAGDGETNGQELGDPCCVWTPNGEHNSDPIAASNSKGISTNATYQEMVLRIRSIQLSDPSDPNSVSKTKAPFEHVPPCTIIQGEEDEIELDAIEIMRAVKPGPSPASTGEQISTLLLALMAIHLVLSCGTVDDALNLPVRTMCGLLVLVFFWTDLVGGCVHIVLDNPAVGNWPLIGPSAKMFQHHHEHPTGLMEEHWGDYFSRHHMPMALFTCTHLTDTSSSNKFVRIFLLLANVFWLLMTAAHRWAHVNPEDYDHPTKGLPLPIRMLQSQSLLLAFDHHSTHHDSFESNFCFLSGWGDVPLNLLLDICPCSLTYPWSLVLLLAGCALPGFLLSQSSTAKKRRAVLLDPAQKPLQQVRALVAKGYYALVPRPLPTHHRHRRRHKY